MHDLQSFNLDLHLVNLAGFVLVSKIVCNKLPSHFLIELSRETSTNYSDFSQLLKVYQSILARLRVNSKDNHSIVKEDVQVNKSSCKDGAKPKKSKSSGEKDVSGNKFWPVKITSAKCRFCSSSEHTTINCDVYPSV